MGLFITIEGTDGSGKTTLIKGLRAALESNSVYFTREPGGTSIGTRIRNILLEDSSNSMSDLTEVYLFAAARSQHVSEIILPKLKKGMTVISDRFLDSSVAYQGGGRQIGEKIIENINKFAIQQLEPDLTIFLNINPEIGLSRINSLRSNEVNRLDQENLTFYNNVRDSYKKIISKNPQRFFIIDATLPQEEILRLVLKKINEL